MAELAKTIEEEWDDFDEVKKPVVDIIIFPKKQEEMKQIQNNVQGKRLLRMQDKIDYGCLYLMIADGLKKGLTFMKISSEVARFMKDNGLTLHNFDILSEVRIIDIVHGVRDCMTGKKSDYESNFYPCHKKHYDFGVWLYREFSKNDVFHAEVKDAFTTI